MTVPRYGKAKQRRQRLFCVSPNCVIPSNFGSHLRLKSAAAQVNVSSRSRFFLDWEYNFTFRGDDSMATIIADVISRSKENAATRLSRS